MKALMKDTKNKVAYTEIQKKLIPPFYDKGSMVNLLTQASLILLSKLIFLS